VAKISGEQRRSHKGRLASKFSEFIGCCCHRKMLLLAVLTTLAGLLTLGEGIENCKSFTIFGKNGQSGTFMVRP